MKVIIKREFKNYMKSPLFWIGMIIVLAGVYQQLKPYLKIHYFESDQEIQDIHVSNIRDADIMDGYIPSSAEQIMEWGTLEIKKQLIEHRNVSEAEAINIVDLMKEMDSKEATTYLEKEYDFYGADYFFDNYELYQGSKQEVNDYLKDKFQEHSFTYYFGRKFADFGGLYMAFFSTVLLAFLFLGDTRKDTYELLHTKPITSCQYVLGKISGGFLIMLCAIGILNLVFGIFCEFYGRSAGFPVKAIDMVLATCIYILPNMLMITCVYAFIAFIFKNPLPAVPLLFLYIVYSNMGSRGPDGKFGYYGRALAIMVRFPGHFLETTPPPMVLLNQTFLLFVSSMLMILTICIWKRRRLY